MGAFQRNFLDVLSSKIWEPVDNPSFRVVSVLAEMSNSRQWHTKGKAAMAETSEGFQMKKEMVWEAVPTCLNLVYPTSTSVP